MMAELFEEMKNHKLTYVFIRTNTFKVELENGEEVQANSAALLTKILKAIRS
ncbi:hypothetical protein ACR9HT_17855 [Enterobacter wuhouensis]